MPYQIPSYTTDGDISVSNAYVVLRRITYIAGTSNDTAIYAVYKNAATFAINPLRTIGRIEVNFDINPLGGSFITQANTALLELPEMAGAVQV